MQRWVVAVVSCLATACFQETDPMGGNDGTATSETTAEASASTSAVDSTSNGSASETDATTLSADTSGGAASTDTGEDTTDPAGCDQGTACLPVPMPGWEGPVALLRAPANAPALMCPPEFEDAGASFADVDPGTVTCECSCLGANLSCDYLVTVHDTAICQGGMPQSVGVGAGDCVDASLLLETPGSVDFIFMAGTPVCAPPDVGQATVPPSYATQFRACTPTSTGPCGDGECYPEPTQMPSVGGLCVFQDGDVPCDPTSAFTDRYVTHTNIVDQRTCQAGDCTCEPVTGTCNASLQVFETLGCPGMPKNAIPAAGCSQATGMTSVRVVDAPMASCGAALNDVPPVGDVVLEGTRTYCCRSDV
mgnify:CR=1 FL=1